MVARGEGVGVGSGVVGLRRNMAAAPPVTRTRMKMARMRKIFLRLPLLGSGMAGGGSETVGLVGGGGGGSGGLGGGDGVGGGGGPTSEGVETGGGVGEENGFGA